MDILNFIGLTAACAVGLHYFARLLERSDRSHRRKQRLADIRKRNLERDELTFLTRMRDRNQPEAVDAMVIRHLRG